MVRLTVLYPKSAASYFEMDYYLQKHTPLARESFTPFGLVRVELEEGLAGGAPDTPPAYHMIASFSFNTMEELQQAVSSQAEKLKADIPNFTDSQPQMQISREVEL